VAADVGAVFSVVAPDVDGFRSAGRRADLSVVAPVLRGRLYVGFLTRQDPGRGRGDSNDVSLMKENLGGARVLPSLSDSIRDPRGGLADGEDDVVRGSADRDWNVDDLPNDFSRRRRPVLDRAATREEQRENERREREKPAPPHGGFPEVAASLPPLAFLGKRAVLTTKKQMWKGGGSTSQSLTRS